MSDSLRPHGLQHAKPFCSSPTLRVYSNSCPLSWWCHPTISSSVVPFSSHLQSFPASGSFQMSQFFTLGGQIMGVSASASVLPMNIHDWFPLGWTGWISLLSKWLSRVFSNIQFKSIHSSAFSFLYSPTLTSIHDYYILHPYCIYIHTTSIHDKTWSTGKWQTTSVVLPLEPHEQYEKGK